MRRPAPRASHPRMRVLLGGLLAGLLGACRPDGALTVVNLSEQVVTAVFDRDGRDLLAGVNLPPGTFTRVEPSPVDTGQPGALEAYTASGACARVDAHRGRWEIRSADLDPGGC